MIITPAAIISVPTATSQRRSKPVRGSEAASEEGALACFAGGPDWGLVTSSGLVTSFDGLVAVCCVVSVGLGGSFSVRGVVCVGGVP
jgi:hypothetical protein